MYNPFSEVTNNTDSDEEIIARALSGDSLSLEKLILRHQAWIYNIAFKMVMDHDDASDISQEIVIKMITNLSVFDFKKSAFRTWLYRITMNHILSLKRKKFEYRIYDFDRYVSLIKSMPDQKPENDPEANLLAQEFKVGCMMGMLMCLSRNDRMAFILGGIFEVKDTVGSELMDISRVNFRKKLSRARKELLLNMEDVCVHVNSSNKCSCINKYRNFVDAGRLDSKNLRYHKPEEKTVKEVLEKRLIRFTDKYYDPFLNHFKKQPFYVPKEITTWFRGILEQDEFKGIFNLH